MTRKGRALGGAQGTCAGASEPDSLPSKLADLPVSESLISSAAGPALAAEPPRTDHEGLISDSAEGAKALDCFGHSRDSHPSGYLRQASPRNPMRRCSGRSTLDPFPIHSNWRLFSAEGVVFDWNFNGGNEKS